MFRSSIITYDGLPLSKGGAHRLRTPNPKLALQQARDFLSACTDNSIPKVTFVEVIRGHSFDDEFSLPLIERLTRTLGGSSRRQAGTRNIAHRWNLRADQIDEYVDMMNEELPLPVDPFGLQPFVVAAQINFRIWIHRRAWSSLAKSRSYTATIHPTQDRCWAGLNSMPEFRGGRPFRYS